MKYAIYNKQTEELKKRIEDIKKLCTEKQYPLQMEYCGMQELSSEKTLEYDGILIKEAAVRELYKYIRQCRKVKVNFASKKQIYTFEIEDIYFIEADMRNVIIHLREDKLLIHVLISDAEQILGDYSFIRVHRSFIVNAMHIKCLTKKNVVLDNGMKVDVSRYRYDEVRAAYLEMTESMGAVSVFAGQ